jgi:hypothetical protein
MIEGLFRNLTSRGLGANNIANNGREGGFKVRLMGSAVGEQKPQIFSTWLRLPSWRAMPASITASTFRITCHSASSQVAGAGCVLIAANQTRAGVGQIANALPTVGQNRLATERTAQAYDSQTNDKQLRATWRSVQSAQIPQYLFFCLQKTSKLLSLGMDSGTGDTGLHVSDWSFARGAPPGVDRGDAAGLTNYFYSRQQDANASIVDFSLSIQSSVGAFVMSSQKYPFIRKKLDLWKYHLKNCVDGYCDSSVQQWSKHKSCLLIHASDFLRGLSTVNCAFPVQFDAEIVFQNRREFIDGNAAACIGKEGPAVMQDCIAGDPTMCMIFTGGSMTIAPSSAVTAQANLSHASALDILSRQ